VADLVVDARSGACECCSREPCAVKRLRARVDVLGIGRDRGSDTLIAPSRVSAPGLHSQLLATWRANGGDPERIRETDSPTTTLALVQAGLGVTMMPAALADMAWRGLRTVPVRQHHPAIETAVAWRHDSTSPVLRRFLRIALSTPEPDVLGPDHARSAAVSPAEYG
jgi:DNA-binding transcriptional LysR family regulator